VIKRKLTTLAEFVLIPVGPSGRTAFIAVRLRGNVDSAGRGRSVAPVSAEYGMGVQQIAYHLSQVIVHARLAFR